MTLKFKSIELYIIILLLAGLISCKDNETVSKLNTDASIEKKVALDSKENEITNNHTIAPVGTQLLPGSKKTMFTNELSPFSLKKVVLSECNTNGESIDYSKHQKLINIDRTDSTFTIDFSFIATCGSNFLCEVEMKDDNCLNLIYHQYNSNADCRCSYGLQFIFNRNDYFEPYLYENMDDLPKIKLVQFNGQNKTLLE